MTLPFLKEKYLEKEFLLAARDARDGVKTARDTHNFLC